MDSKRKISGKRGDVRSQIEELQRRMTENSEEYAEINLRLTPEMKEKAKSSSKEDRKEWEEFVKSVAKEQAKLSKEITKDGKKIEKIAKKKVYKPHYTLYAKSRKLFAQLNNTANKIDKLKEQQMELEAQRRELENKINMSSDIQAIAKMSN